MKNQLVVKFVCITVSHLVNYSHDCLLMLLNAVDYNSFTYVVPGFLDDKNINL